MCSTTTVTIDRETVIKRCEWVINYITEKRQAMEKQEIANYLWFANGWRKWFSWLGMRALTKEQAAARMTGSIHYFCQYPSIYRWNSMDRAETLKKMAEMAEKDIIVSADDFALVFEW